MRLLKKDKSSVSRFLAGNPDDFYGEDCLSIYINDGYWNDDICDYKRGYICKRRGETLFLMWLVTRTQNLGFLLHVGETILISSFPGNTPEPPPPHDGNHAAPEQTCNTRKSSYRHVSHSSPTQVS